MGLIYHNVLLCQALPLEKVFGLFVTVGAILVMALRVNLIEGRGCVGGPLNGARHVNNFLLGFGRDCVGGGQGHAFCRLDNVLAELVKES